MSVATFNPSKADVRATLAAVAHFKRQLAADGQARAVRLSVKESGCTGFRYVVDMVDGAQKDNDFHCTLDDGLELFVAADSLSVVSGTEIDYVKEGVNQQLKFNNPKANEYCGCGESFSISED